MSDRMLELWDAIPFWFMASGFLLMGLGILIGAIWAGLCQRNDAADRFASERMPTDMLGFPCDPEDAEPVPFRLVDDRDPEKSILSTMLQDRDYIVDGIQAGLTERNFDRPGLGILYEVLVDLFTADMATDLMALHEHLAEGRLLETVGGPAMLTEVLTYAPTDRHFDDDLVRVLAASAASPADDLDDLDEIDPSNITYLEPEARPWGERIDPKPATT